MASKLKHLTIRCIDPPVLTLIAVPSCPWLYTAARVIILLNLRASSSILAWVAAARISTLFAIESIHHRLIYEGLHRFEHGGWSVRHAPLFFVDVSVQTLFETITCIFQIKFVIIVIIKKVHGDKIQLNSHQLLRWFEKNTRSLLYNTSKMQFAFLHWGCNWICAKLTGLACKKVTC